MTRLSANSYPYLRDAKTKQLIREIAPREYVAPLSFLGTRINRVETRSSEMASEVNYLFSERKERLLRADQRAQIRSIIARLSDMQADLSIVLAEQEAVSFREAAE